jgi:hypothetical protein
MKPNLLSLSRRHLGQRTSLPVLLAGAALILTPACSSNNGTPSSGGTGGAAGSPGTGGTGTGGTGTGGTGAGGSGGTSGSAGAAGTAGAGGSGTAAQLKSFTAPDYASLPNNGAGAIVFAASGEVLALSGYPFPPASPDDPSFVDGWDVEFNHLLVTVDKIQLSSDPDKVPTDQSQTGPLVAEVDGPWAVDLHVSSVDYFPGKGGTGEEAAPIAMLTNQNKNGGAPFATDGTRYAFGFETLAATTSAMNVNLDHDALVEYNEMIQDGCSVFYDGTATWKGDQGTNYQNTCSPNLTGTNYADWPKTVHFELCYKSPTSYVNCQNPDNDPANPEPGEEHERGIPFNPNSYVIGQVTIHTDHPFWESVLHDSPAHFDQFAALLAGKPDGSVVSLDMTKGKDYTAYTDSEGHALDWRYCTAPPTDVVNPPLMGVMAFDPQKIPHATGNDPTTGFRDYYDFSTYDQSTQGHLNSDGLCYVKHNYPSYP